MVKVMSLILDAIHSSGGYMKLSQHTDMRLTRLKRMRIPGAQLGKTSLFTSLYGLAVWNLFLCIFKFRILSVY